MTDTCITNCVRQTITTTIKRENGKTPLFTIYSANMCCGVHLQYARISILHATFSKTKFTSALYEKTRNSIKLFSVLKRGVGLKFDMRAMSYWQRIHRLDFE